MCVTPTVDHLAAEQIGKMIADAEYRVAAAERNPFLALRHEDIRQANCRDGEDAVRAARANDRAERAKRELAAARRVRAELIRARDRLIDEAE